MGRAATQIETELTGKDNVTKVFDGVAKKAKQMQDSVNKGSSGGGGFGMAKSVAAGNALFAMLSGVAGKAASAAVELGTLADRSQQMQVSAEYAQKLESTLNQAGLQGVALDSLTAAFDKMTKTTGRVGAEGFEKTLAEIASIGDEQARVTRLGEVFGKSMGPGLAPLLRQGPEAFKAGFADVMAGMPAVSAAAVSASDSMADAFAVANDEVKVGFQSMIGNVVVWMQNTFGMSMEEAIRTFVVNVKWGIGVGWAYFQAFGKNIGMIAEFFVDDFKGAIEWVFNGIVAFAKAAISPFVFLFEAVKAMAVEFGKAFVRWITGDKADWSGAWDKALAKMDDAGKDFKDTWKDLRPEAPPMREWASVDMKALDAQRDAALDAMHKSLEGKGDLASAGAAASADVEQAAAKAVSKISDEMKAAKYVSASSYEAMKIVFDSNRNASGFSRARSLVGASSGGSVATSNGAELAYLTPLREILTLQRSGWEILRKLETA